MRIIIIIIIPLLVIISLLTSCKKEVHPSNNRGTAVTLLLIKPKNNVMRKDADGSTIGIGRPGEELSIIDTMNMFQKISIRYDPHNDTIIIEPHRKHIQVNFLYKVFDVFSYVFEAGDSAMVDYQEGYPRVKIVNRSTLPWDYDWERYTRKTLYKDDYPAFNKFAFPLLYTNDARMVDSLKSVFSDQSKLEIAKENSILDSLYQRKLISSLVYQFYKTRNSFALEIQAISNDNNYVRPSWTRVDSLLKNQFYGNYISSLAAKQIESGIVRIKSTNSVLVDYRIAFDKVVLSTEFSSFEKDMLYLHYMEQIIRFFSKSDIEKYLPKFNENITNKALNSYLISIYNLDFNSSKELRLKNLNQGNLTFAQVLKKHRGNLVYVDFWASWCAPCIASFPHAEKLKKEYKNKNVSFIYLSIDSDFGSWKKASSKYGMIDSANFLVDNKYVSEMIEELQITSIPRYLIYDSKGNLIHKNAPGPKGKELRKIFNKHL